MSTHNPNVFGRFCRALLVLALAPWLVGAAAMPMEHAHEGDADHHQTVVHRHLDAHESGTHHHPEETEIEGAHDEGLVVWLTNVSLHQRAYHLSIDWAVINLTPETLLDSTDWIATRSYDASLPHAPPRPSRSPRAPPLLHV